MRSKGVAGFISLLCDDDTQIVLVAGQYYYMEVLHTESTGSDSVLVGAVFPNNTAAYPQV